MGTATQTDVERLTADIEIWDQEATKWIHRLSVLEDLRGKPEAAAFADIAWLTEVGSGKFTASDLLRSTEKTGWGGYDKVLDGLIRNVRSYNGEVIRRLYNLTDRYYTLTGKRYTP